MSLLVCLAVAGLCWRRPAVRWGGLLSAGLVAAAYLLPTPVGTTASRLPELFAAPIIVAVAAIPLVALIAATASVVLLLPPVSIREVQERGDPALSDEFYAPLLNQLVARGVSGPIEVVPTRRRGEAAFVAPAVAIAKGWSRPADTGRNAIFYDGTLNADTYRKWLDDNAISYIWPRLKGHMTGRRPMKSPWYAADCRTCQRCGLTKRDCVGSGEPEASHLTPRAGHRS